MKTILLILTLCGVASGLTTLSPTVIPLHYGVCKGGPYINNERISTLTVSSQADSGQKYITFTNVDSLMTGQLICYTTTSVSRNDYYTTKIAEINGNTIKCEDNLECAIQSGNNVTPFYFNYSHPNSQGMYAIIDYSFRYMIQNNKLGDQNRILNLYSYDLQKGTLINGSTLSFDSINSPTNPGCVGYPSAIINCDNSGIGYGAGLQPAGNYGYDVCINTVDSGSILSIIIKSGNSTIDSSVYVSEGQSVKIFTKSFTTNNSDTLKIFITKNTGTFKLGYVRIVKKINSTENLNRGTHVILGDSWSAYGQFTTSIQRQLPLATVYNVGVGGNTSEQCYNRFDADVASKNPQFVWLMVGTNDYFWSEQYVFNHWMQLLIKKCYDVGAKLIVFDPSVGAVVCTGKENYELTNSSKKYTLVTDYNIDLKNPIVNTVRYNKFKISKEYVRHSSSHYPYVLKWDIPESELAYIKDAGNISVVNLQKNKLPKYVDFFDLNNKKIVISFDCSADTSKDQYIFIKYGLDISELNDTNAYINSNYMLRSNFNEARGKIASSTGKNSATDTNSYLVYNKQGKLDKSIYYGIAGAYTSFGNIQNFGGVSSLTITSLMYRYTKSSYQAVWCKDCVNGVRLAMTTYANSPLYVFVTNGDAAYLNNYSNYLPINSWSIVKVVFDLSKPQNTDKIKLYVNGLLVHFTGYIGTLPAVLPTTSAEFFVGYPTLVPDIDIDEFRISSIAETDGQALTEYNNFFKHDSLFTNMGEVTVGGGARKYAAYRAAFKDAFKRAWR